MFPTRRWRAALPCALLSLCAILDAHAGVFSVTPVRIYMTPRDRAVAVTLINEGTTPVVLQADVNVWRQSPDGTDTLELTEDLILSPPIVTLAPQARQVVRLARLAPMPTERELTYRLVVREVPEALATRDKAMEVPIALALNMPIFITPPLARHQVTCGLAPGGASLQVRCDNQGSAYAQVRELRLEQGDRLVGRFEGGSYLLPGASRILPLAPQQPAAAGEARLTVVFDDFKTQSFAARLP